MAFNGAWGSYNGIEISKLIKWPYTICGGVYDLFGLEPYECQFSPRKACKIGTFIDILWDNAETTLSAPACKMSSIDVLSGGLNHLQVCLISCILFVLDEHVRKVIHDPGKQPDYREEHKEEK